MSNHSTVTYFRTTLDPLDMYRIERIIDHGEDMGTATPAAALAVYLRGIDPSLRWHRTGLDLDTSATGAVKGMGDIVDDYDAADLMYCDAAVFTHGTNRAVLNPPHSFRWGFPSRATCTPKEMQDLSLHQR